MRGLFDKVKQNDVLAAIARLAAYAATTAVAAVATFLTTPVLVRFLGLKGFGGYSLVEPLLVTTAAVALLGSDSGVLKRIAYDRVDLRKAIGALLPFLVPVLLCVGTLVVLIAPHITGVAVSPLILGSVLAGEAMLLFLTTAFRGANRTGPYAVAQGGRALLLLALLLCLAKQWGHGHGSIELVLMARAIVSVSLVAALLLYVKPALRIDWPEYRNGVQYGIFVVATSVLSAFQENFDRYVIAGVSGQESVGAYVVCIKVAAIVAQSVVLPLMIWFPAERLRHIQDPDGGERFFRTTALALLSLLLAVSGGVVLCGRQLVNLIGPGTPYTPAVLVLIVTAAIAGGMAHPLNIGLFKPGLSHLNMYPVAVSSAIGFCLAQWWVVHSGVTGVAAAKTISSFLGLSMIYFLSQRAHPVRLDLPKLAAMVATAGVTLSVLTSPRAYSLALWSKVTVFVLIITGMAILLVGRAVRSFSNTVTERVETVEV